MKSVPFLVEKVSEFILENISFHLKRLYAEEDIQTSASDDAREATDLLFDSMRLLKLMPNFIMEHNSLKIAKRLCGILRYIYIVGALFFVLNCLLPPYVYNNITPYGDRIAAALFPPQPYSLPLVSVTHWHTLFSTAAWACSDFLPFSSSSSPASSSDECRALIWTEIVTAFITPTNAIHALNFTPCRHLVLRFLHKYYLS